MTAISPSRYDEITIESSDGKFTTIDLRLGVASFYYYEDLLSPTITAQLVIVSAEGVVSNSDKTDKKESLYNGLPIRGGERVSIRIAGNSENNAGLKFDTPETYLYVSKVSNVIRDGQKEIFVLNLVSREAIANELTHVTRKFSRDIPVSDNVEDILKNDLKVKSNRFKKNIDRTSNKLGFIGNLKKPFKILVWLASKSSSTVKDSIAGYFFYQTKDGFHFRSVDELIRKGLKKPAATFTHKQFTNKLTERTDFNILNYSIKRNNDLLKKLIIGQYSSFTVSFDPYTGGFSKVADGVFSLDQNFIKKKLKNLGEVVEVPKILSETGQTTGQLPSRIISLIKDVGTLDKEASAEANSEANIYQKQAILRYNLIFQQMIYLVTPLNTEVSVGNVVELKFIGTPEGQDYDRQQSGFYLVKELCHSFDPERSITSMTVIRDTFGEFAKD